MKPMLAKKYVPRKVQFPCLIQPKLNGIRGIYTGGDTMQSRSNGLDVAKLWNPDVVRPFVEVLQKLKLNVDGEFYCHGMSLQKINSRIAINSNQPHRDIDQLTYNIFDIISDLPQNIRLEKLEELEGQLEYPVKIVQTYYCVSSSFAEQAYRNFRDEGYEGMMYRTYDAPYGREHNCPNKENRWNCLLKRKEWQDMDCTCVGVNESSEFIAIKEPHLATLQLRTDDGVVFNSAGMDHSQKVNYLHNPPIDKRVKIKYEVLSDSGKPLKPCILLVND